MDTMLFHKKLAEELDKAKIMVDICKKGTNYVYENTGNCGIHTIDIGIDCEPYRVGVYGKYAKGSEQFILQACICNMITIWYDYLSDLVREYLVEEKSNSLDLMAKISLGDILNEPKTLWINNYLKDYDFFDYKEKLRIAEKITDHKIETDYRNKLFQSIEVRNSIQHHECKVVKSMIRKLGTSTICLYDIEGNLVNYVEDDLIKLSIPELMSIRNCILNCMYTLFEGNGRDYNMHYLSDIYPSKYPNSMTIAMEDR
jgi:hypothetical protein